MYITVCGRTLKCTLKMKHFLRHYLINLFTLFVTSYYIGGFHIAPGIDSLLLVGLGFTAIHLLLKPILNIITGPINFLTFGLIGLIIDAAILYSLTMFLPKIWISAWTFPGFANLGVTIDPIPLNIIMVTILSAFILGFIRSVILSLCD